MITNERQYRIASAEAAKFERMLEQLERAPAGEMDPLLREAEIGGVRSQLEDLRTRLAEYDRLKSGGHFVLVADSLEELPDLLIKGRVAADMSQRELAERINLKEQQIQRYEASRYAGASLSRLQQIADAIGVRVRKEVFLPPTEQRHFDVFGRLRELGLEKRFVLTRLIPDDIAALAEHQPQHPDVIFHTLSATSRIFGWTPEALAGAGPVFSHEGVLGAARFKVSARAEQKRLSAYTFYAHYLALLLLQASEHLEQRSLPSGPLVVRREILSRFGHISLETVLNYVWDAGIPVLPLADRGAFHGATWRVDGRNVIVLKQQTRSCDRWLHDILHELWHTIQEPEAPSRSVIEASETSPDRLDSDEEWDATQFASDVLLQGRAEELAQAAVNATKPRRGASGRLEYLKQTVQMVAMREDVPVGALANYLAFRLAVQGEDWWGTAQNLQSSSNNPWVIARDVLLQRARIGHLEEPDRSILLRAIVDVEDHNE